MISVVIPTLNDGYRLVPTLASLVPAAAQGLVRELIIVDGGSQDDTETVVDIAGGHFIAHQGNVGERLAAGARTAKGPWLLFLTPGPFMEEGWLHETKLFIEKAERHGRNPRAAIFAFRPDSYGVQAGLREALVRLRLTLRLGPVAEQGLLIGKAHYESIGGHPQGDQAATRLGRRLGGRLVPLRSRVLVPEGDDRQA